MSFFESTLSIVLIFALGYVAWKYQVQPELERRKAQSAIDIKNKELFKTQKNIIDLELKR